MIECDAYQYLKQETAMSLNEPGESFRPAFSEEEDEVFKAAGADKNKAIAASPVMIEAPAEQLPPYIKVDCSVNEEIFVPGCGCVSIFAGIFLANIGDGSAFEYIGYFIIASGIAAVIARKFIDNFYIINTAERKIFYRRKVFNNITITPYLESDDIHAVSVSCGFYKNKSSHWWEYKVVLIKKDGLIVEFGDSKKEESAAEFNKAARGIAAVLQCGYIECPDKHALITFKQTNGGVRVYFFKKE